MGRGRKKGGRGRQEREKGGVERKGGGPLLSVDACMLLNSYASLIIKKSCL